MANPVYVDASQLTSTLQAAALNSSSIAQPSNRSKADRFWASTKSSITDPTKEVLEIDFASAGLVNRIAFDSVRFPQTISLEYTQDNGNTWSPVLDRLTQQPIQVVTLQSFPAVLPSPVSIAGHRHPQHDYDGHWTRHGFETVPDDMQKIRFVIQRNSAGIAPVDVTGASMPYSVALQNIEVGYEIRSHDDVPRSILEAESKQTGEVFANSVDLFDSNLGFAERVRYANNLRFNTDASAPFIWKSEPQPFPSAIVNFYADLRDSNGNSQIIDRIFIDPLFEGPYINLYYSDQTEVDTFPSSRIALSSTDASVINGNINQISGRMELGTFVNPYQLTIQAQTRMFATAVEDSSIAPPVPTVNVQFIKSYAQINNSSLSFDPSRDWWVGMSFLPTADPILATTGVFYPLLSCTQFEIGYYNGIDPITNVLTAYAYFKTAAGDLNSVPIYVDPLLSNISEIKLVAAYKGGTLHLSVDRHGVTNSIDKTASVAFNSTLPPSIFIGTGTLTQRFTNPSISAFILKQETWTDDGFIDNPTGYSRVARFPTQTEFGGQNALVRFDPTLVSITSQSGLVGGPAFSFENLTWTPVPRTYAMHRGSMILPATKARFWNLEITNLRPELNDKYVPITRVAKTFPGDVVAAFDLTSNPNDRQSYDDLPTDIQTQLANAPGFADIPLYSGTGADSQSFSDTEVYVAADATTALRLQDLGTEWTYRQWHPDVRVPRFNKISQHNYTEQTFQQTSNVSYYCGLRNLQFQRTTNTVPQNQSIIEEDFLDTTGIDPKGGWIVSAQAGTLTSGGSVFAQTKSVNIPTQRGVRALQFASQQSDSKQINLYGDFSDKSYDPANITDWSQFGDSKVLGLTSINSSDDVALLVSRQNQYGFWADPKTAFSTDSTFTTFLGGSYGAVTRYDPAQYPSKVTVAGISTTYAALTKGQSNAQYFGGITSNAVPIPDGGRLFAAARVTATTALDNPLWIQILDGDTGGVLSEQQMNVSKGKIQEWYTEYDIGQNLDTYTAAALKWSDLGKNPISSSFNDTFNRSDANALGNMVPSGQPWVVATTPHHIASNRAVTNITGDRDEFDAKTPWGTFQVTLPNLPTTTGALLDLGGIILQGNGALYSTITSVTFGTVTLAAGHTYAFKFLPTSQITTGDTTILQPYTLQVFDNGTLVNTFNMAHSFKTVRALLGDATQQFDDVIWTPSKTEVSVYNQMETLPIPATSDLISTNSSDNSFRWAQPIAGTLASDLPRYRNWLLHGSFTYGTNKYCSNAQALAPGGSFLAAPTGLSVAVTNVTSSPASPGTTFSAVATLFAVPTTTYFWKVTAVNQVGETTGSSEVSATAQQGGSATLTWVRSTGATGYNVYRSTATGTEVLVATLHDTNTYVDTLQAAILPAVTVPTTNTSGGSGTVAVADMMDTYGTLELNVTQMPTGVATSAVPLAYLNYNTATNKITTLYGDGTIKDQDGNTLATIATFVPTADRLLIRYLPAQLFSSTFRTTWSIASTDTQAIVVVQGSTVKAVLHGTAVWDSSWRGIGGAASGTGAGQYSIIEGPGWAPEGAILSPDLSVVTWLQVEDWNTATYHSLAVTPSLLSVRNIQARLVQKGNTNDFWFVQAIGLFWDPILWDFSCDGGSTWWRARDVRNDPNAVLQFPANLHNYSSLKWRVTSFSPDMHISHVAIRPWYSGSGGYDQAPRPTQLPLGPNLTPSDFYTRIESDPRWKTWSNPVPRWWWNAYKSHS